MLIQLLLKPSKKNKKIIDALKNDNQKLKAENTSREIRLKKTEQ